VYDETKAVQVLWGGHVYELHPESNPHSNALAFAQNNTLDGKQGYLVTINSPAEQQFVNSLLAQHNVESIWLGGSDKESEADWKWIGGEEAGEVFWTVSEIEKYSNWGAHEPNNAGGNENCMKHKRDIGWNDVNCHEEKNPLLIEFGDDHQNVGLVPTTSDSSEL